MAKPPRVGHVALGAANLRIELERALGDHAPDGGPDWTRLVATLDLAATQLAWARDAATVIAYRAGQSWPAIERHTGIPDATLHARARRFTDRETDR